jgi:hypothetical protein
MRCVQANLAYLATVMNSAHPAKKLPGPIIMNSPLQSASEEADELTEQVNQLYDKLAVLFDGWKGGRISHQPQQPGQVTGHTPNAGPRTGAPGMAQGMAVGPRGRLNITGQQLQ